MFFSGQLNVTEPTIPVWLLESQFSTNWGWQNIGHCVGEFRLVAELHRLLSLELTLRGTGALQ